MNGLEKTPTYCSAMDVAETLDLPDPVSGSDAYGMMTFSDASHPSIKQVNRMIMANEDIIDRRLRRSWKENRVTNQVLTLNSYWHDQNGWRSNYYSQGGNMLQLRGPIREWNPEQGDKLEMRRRMNTWQDMTDNEYERLEASDENEPVGIGMPMFWFDYQAGRVFIRTRFFQQGANSIRISYRYGEPIDDIPEAVRRLCCLMTSSQVINMQAFNIKVGAGGDIAGVKDGLLRMWQEEMNVIWSSYLKIGKVHSLLRG